MGSSNKPGWDLAAEFVNLYLGTGDVDIRLFDIAGNEVMVVANTIQTAGRHEVRFSAMNLASGSYTLVVRANGATASTPVTIVK